MSETLEERDGWLYMRDPYVSLTKPLEIVSWWPLEVRFDDFALRFENLEEARKRTGRPVTYLGDGLYRDEEGLCYRLVDGGQTKSRFTDIRDIPEPTQRGRKLPVRWCDGRWYKQTSRGWKWA